MSEYRGWRCAISPSSTRPGLRASASAAARCASVGCSARDELTHVLRCVDFGRLRSSRDDAGERRRERLERSVDVRGRVEVVRVALGVHERDARPLARGLAEPVRNDRHLHPQVRADHDDAGQRVEVRDADPERRRGRIRALVAEVAPAQPRVDVVAAEVARDAVQEVQLLERRARAREHADRVAARVRGLGQELGRALERVLPNSRRPSRRFASRAARAGGPRYRARGS